jgi:signal recognition particle subunit SRP54
MRYHRPMFDRLSSGLTAALNTLSGRGYLSEDNISDAVREVRLALLDADVALPVVKSFTEAVKSRAIGVEVTKSLTPGQAFIKVVHEELVRLMGEPSAGLNLRAQRPVVVMLAGLQGAGKTTTAGKLARWLIEKQHKKVLLVSTDVYRPAAIEQLKTLSGQVGAGFAHSSIDEAPVAIAKRALTEATLQTYDVLLIDTAGRLHVDTEMMDEVRALEAAIKPHERLFVVDSMAGQDAVNAAKAFNDALSLTGVILTKADGDARGGAALSVRQVTGKPILFVGTGEKSEALELFHPERIASRILGMGDVLALVEQVQEQVDQAKAEKLAKKISKGKSFDLSDLRDQLSQLQKMGGMSALLDKLPAQLQANAAAAAGQVNPP